jgi:hypothetical protein
MGYFQGGRFFLEVIYGGTFTALACCTSADYSFKVEQSSEAGRARPCTYQANFISLAEPKYVMNLRIFQVYLLIASTLAIAAPTPAGRLPPPDSMKVRCIDTYIFPS